MDECKALHDGHTGCGGVRRHGWGVVPADGQGLTLVHFSAQLESCLTHKNTLHTINTP
jgi:hypothetical protein